MAISEDQSRNGSLDVDYKHMYKNLKRKFMILLQENECFQAELRRCQGEYIQATRDNDFLLERLMQYENREDSCSDSDATDSSDDEGKQHQPQVKSQSASKTTVKTEPHDDSVGKPIASSSKSSAASKRKRASESASQEKTSASTASAAKKKRSSSASTVASSSTNTPFASKTSKGSTNTVTTTTMTTITPNVSTAKTIQITLPSNSSLSIKATAPSSTSFTKNEPMSAPPVLLHHPPVLSSSSLFKVKEDPTPSSSSQDMKNKRSSSIGSLGSCVTLAGIGSLSQSSVLSDDKRKSLNHQLFPPSNSSAGQL